MFVIVLTGSEATAFGIQKDYLCARSAWFKEHFETVDNDPSRNQEIEKIIPLPEVTTPVFALAQHYLFTGKVIPGEGNVPPYEPLIELWKLGNSLQIEGLCDKALEAMHECRRVTQRIPATPLLIEVWRTTPESSSIRHLLLDWSAEYMNTADGRNVFARSLPREVLTELVILMAERKPLLEAQTPVQAAPPPQSPAAAAAAPTQQTNPVITIRKNVHYLDDGDDESEEEDSKVTKKRRPSGGNAIGKKTPAARKLPAAKSTMPRAPTKRRSLAAQDVDHSDAQRLVFCSDLINRMLSGPGKGASRPLCLIILEVQDQEANSS
jgi:hypothetical protein